MIKTDLQVIEMEEVQAAKDLGADGPELSVAELNEFVLTDEKHYIEKCKCGAIVAQCRCMKANKKVIIVQDSCTMCRKGN